MVEAFGDRQKRSVSVSCSTRTLSFDFYTLVGLEAFLSTRSYIEGFEPSQADVVVYREIQEAPSILDGNPNIIRWHTHIASYIDEFDSLPGDSDKPGPAYSFHAIVDT